MVIRYVGIGDQIELLDRGLSQHIIYRCYKYCCRVILIQIRFVVTSYNRNSGSKEEKEKNTIPDSTSILADRLAEVSLHKNNRPHRSQSFYINSNNQFPLPSFCLYSRAALSDEYASDSDIIQFISPQSTTMEERLPMFVGVLHSLFVAVNDLPFDSDSDTEDDDDDVEEDDIKGESIKHCVRGNVTERVDDDEMEGEEGDNTIHQERTWIKEGKSDNNPYTIIGLNTMKIITCNLVETAQMQDISKELGLVIMIPVYFSDATISYYTNMLYNSITKSNMLSNSTAKDIGEKIGPMIHYWFSQFHGDKIITKKDLK
ncbi:hypothetical protein K501DRAFT_336232 [Backusella circina FSU 941]|nr:hypothetical protein K501DRAFT_336232 [Backusella circina FSU 941]